MKQIGFYAEGEGESQPASGDAETRAASPAYGLATASAVEWASILLALFGLVFAIYSIGSYFGKAAGRNEVIARLAAGGLVYMETSVFTNSAETVTGSVAPAAGK